MLIIFAVGGMALFILGVARYYYVLILSVLMIFLGITDFGRRCPLVLSLKYLLFRIRSKRIPPAV
jgi:hypothetical protein